MQESKFNIVFFVFWTIRADILKLLGRLKIESPRWNLRTDASNFLIRTVNLWTRLKIIHLRKIVPKKQILPGNLRACRNVKN